ncbi:unnamed protein product [Didymodactylos carnosus]|uniref:Uncharacterized protein n=1 Tax=Didymodactylos carnosus TaxID=1234261 RepID=A0A814FQ72_9BILA|nr:unnamed protein product [Didymodactylos carnosus]CAF3758084.1 unnamed protein product [Didymodactylos carnosus]
MANRPSRATVPVFKITPSAAFYLRSSIYKLTTRKHPQVRTNKKRDIHTYVKAEQVVILLQNTKSWQDEDSKERFTNQVLTLT